MIYFFVAKSVSIGVGHFHRSKKIEEYYKYQKKKTKFYTFLNLSNLKKKIKNIRFNKSDTIFFDSYLFDSEIKQIFIKTKSKIIIINDFQYKIDKNFFDLNSFRYSNLIKKTVKTKNYYGLDYLPELKARKKYKKKKKNKISVIFGSTKKKLFLKILKKKLKDCNCEILFFNFDKNLLSNFNIENLKIFGFVEQDILLNHCSESKYVICCGGDTMMKLIINNITPNVFYTEKNQKLFFDILSQKKHIFDITKLKKLKINTKNTYINKRKNKLLKIL